MRAVTTGFLFFGYMFLAMTVGALLWRGGLGTGTGVAATLGTLGILAAVHVATASALKARALGQEIAQVREAHRLLADAMEQTQGALSDLAQAIESGGVEEGVAGVERAFQHRLGLVSPRRRAIGPGQAHAAEPDAGDLEGTDPALVHFMLVSAA